MRKKSKDDKYIKVHISMEPKLFNKLKRQIINNGQSRSEIIRNALRNHLKKTK